MIFDILMGKSYGKMHCPFHEGDDTASLSVASDGRFHCFGCGVGGHDDITFAQRYYSVSRRVAERVVLKFNNLPRYKYDANLSEQDMKYLSSIGISNEVQKKMFRSASGKLVYPHKYKGVIIDHTWFNYEGSITYNPERGKYSRDRGSVSGFLTPYNFMNKDTIIITEGEKDMLTMLSNDIPAVSIVGGANTLPYMMQRELEGKNVVIIYDCDEAGRQGASKLTYWLYSIGVNAVKNVDLGLENGEDINDWFVKYGMSREALITLINATPIAEKTSITSHKVFRLYQQITKQLNDDEQEELRILLNKEMDKDE